MNLQYFKERYLKQFVVQGYEISSIMCKVIGEDLTNVELNFRIHNFSRLNAKKLSISFITESIHIEGYTSYHFVLDESVQLTEDNIFIITKLLENISIDKYLRFLFKSFISFYKKLQLNQTHYYTDIGYINKLSFATIIVIYPQKGYLV